MADDVQSRSVTRRLIASTPAFEGKIKLLFRQCIRRARVKAVGIGLDLPLPEEHIERLVDEFAGLTQTVITMSGDAPVLTAAQRDLLIDLAAYCEDSFKDNSEERWGREAGAVLRLVTGSKPGHDSEGPTTTPSSR